MTFLLSSDLIQLQASVKGYVEANFPQGGLKDRHSRDAINLKQKWQEFSAQGFLLGGVSEELGGLGLGFLSNVVVVKEVARTLAPLPALETLLFGVLPLRYLSEGEGTILPKLLEGSEVATGIIGEENVPEASLATLLMTEDDSEIYSASFVMNATAQRSGVELLREIVTLSELSLSTSQKVGVLGDSSPLLFERLLLLSAEMIGASRTAEELTLDYVKTRKQFGVAIGTFQALQHKLADARVGLDAAESLLHFSSWARDNDLSQFQGTALAAYQQCYSSSKKALETFIQVHGGIGFTYEYDLHLFLRRVLNLSAWFISPAAATHNLALSGLEETLNT